MTFPGPTVPGIFPPGARTLLIGQAPGAVEVRLGRPFVGPAGRELAAWCRMARLDHTRCAITNVFNEPLPWTVELRLLGGRKPASWPDDPFLGGLEAITAATQVAKAEGWLDSLPPLSWGRHLRPEWRWHLTERLAEEVRTTAPDLIVAFGAEALWACSGHFDITAKRGTFFQSNFGPPAIATYHPAYILRGGWKHRTTAIGDLLKAARGYAEPPRRALTINPDRVDLDKWFCVLSGADLIAIDIETSTAMRQITSVAFAPSPTMAICVPFVVGKGASYWPTLGDEVAAWAFVRDVCALPIPKLLQNGLYDLQWLWIVQRIAVRAYLHDTRLAHHALWPELPKSLGFMGSVHENEFAWKGLRHLKTEKRDD